MAASRWNVDLNDVMYGIDTEITDFEEEILYLDENDAPVYQEQPLEPIEEAETLEQVKLPEVLPILPLRGLVVYPQTGSRAVFAWLMMSSTRTE